MADRTGQEDRIWEIVPQAEWHSGHIGVDQSLYMQHMRSDVGRISSCALRLNFQTPSVTAPCLVHAVDMLTCTHRILAIFPWTLVCLSLCAHVLEAHASKIFLMCEECDCGAIESGLGTRDHLALTESSSPRLTSSNCLIHSRSRVVISFWYLNLLTFLIDSPFMSQSKH